MNLIINLGNKESSLSILERIKNNDYVPFDIKITNSHTMNLDALIGKKIFTKDNLYLDSRTLWEIMQPVGGKGRHNYHGLTSEDIYESLSSINEPDLILFNSNNRYSLVTTYISHFGEPVLIIVEVKSGLIKNQNARINKIITMFPKSKKRINVSIKDAILLYIKKWVSIPAPIALTEYSTVSFRSVTWLKTQRHSFLGTSCWRPYPYQ